MKKLLPALCLLLAWCLLAASTSLAGSIFPYKVHKETLENGLTVLIIPMDNPGLVSYYSVVRTGSRDEVVPGRTGFAHFFEHVMFKGTKKYSREDFDRITTGMGASTNASTSDDITQYFLNFSKEDLEQVIDLESDRFRNLEYSKQEFQTEAGAIYGEYRKNVTSPYAALYEKLQDVAYDVHTYKHTTMGFEKDIKAMPEGFDYSLEFYDRFYRPENVVLVIAGDVEPSATMTLVKKYYSPWKKGYKAAEIPTEPPQTAERTAEINFPGKTLPIIAIAYKGDAFDPKSRDFVAARLLNDLAFGSTSDLYKKLYLQEQKVQSLGGDVGINRDPGLFDIMAQVKKVEDINYVRDEIYRTLEEFKTKPADAKRLNDLKRRMKYGFLMGLDTPARVASSLTHFVAVTGGIEAIDQMYTTMDEITPDDIMRAAQKYYVPEHRTVVVLKGAQQ